MTTKKLTDEMKAQVAYCQAAEELLNLAPVLMADAIGIPYNSYKDLKNGRRSMRPVIRRVIELLKIIECGGVKDERRVLKTMRREFQERKVTRATNARALRWPSAAA